ncbi:hypothetical protein ON010_g2864 [Phytophthora cinnamomi]|nr:hypothetical protein ON010_g2864 [Phytophthora cinnamomi]
MKAADGRYTDIVSVLLKNGAHVDQRGASGTTALQFACANGSLGVVTLLVDNGALTNEDVEKLVAVAGENGHQAVASCLSRASISAVGA